MILGFPDKKSGTRNCYVAGRIIEVYFEMSVVCFFHRKGGHPRGIAVLGQGPGLAWYWHSWGRVQPDRPRTSNTI